ncbi:hypothetical protein Tco_0785000, partial [Tanacetum coccineum]
PKVHTASATVESTFNYAEELARLQGQAYEANSAAKDTWKIADTVPAGSGVPATSIPAGSIHQAAGGSAVPSTPSSSMVEPVHADTPLPPGHSLGSSEHSTRFSSPSDLANHISSSLETEGIYHHPTTDIFSESTYDANFGGLPTNLAPTIAVDPIPTRRVHTVHPISHIIGDITSPVLTRDTLKKSKFGECALSGYVHDQQRNNHTDYLHYLFACFLSQLEPRSVAQALNDPAYARGDATIKKRMPEEYKLGIKQVKQQPDGIFISQDKYVQDMLRRFDMESVRPATTPYEAAKPNSLKGSSRPDIMFAQPKHGLWYPRDSPFVLEAYSDSDYAGSNGDRKSTTGGCQFLGRRLISWQCKKQTVMATFSREAEYVAAAATVVVTHGVCGLNLMRTIRFVGFCVHFWCLQEFLLCNTGFLLAEQFLLVAFWFSAGRVYKAEYAIVTDPLIYDSLITQFWSTASLRSSELGPPAIVATIDGTPYTITESLVRSQLQLHDEGEFTKSGSWDQFGTPLAIALICLCEGKKYNWSRYIFTGMVNNINNSKKFLMFPRFLQLILDIETRNTKPYHAFRLTSKMFANMRLNFHGDHMPLVAAMLPLTQAAIAAGTLGGQHHPTLRLTMKLLQNLCTKLLLLMIMESPSPNQTPTTPASTD